MSLDKYLNTRENYDKIVKLLKIVVNFCEEHKIQFFLCSGTLMGAVKYKSIMPWDVDLDIMIIGKELDYVNKINNLAKSNNLTIGRTRHGTEGIIKLCFGSGPNGRCSIPNCDLIFVEPDDNDDKYCRAGICTEIKEGRYFVDTMPKDYIYPLKEIEMHGLKVTIPNKSKEILRKTYGPFEDVIIIGFQYDKKTNTIRNLDKTLRTYRGEPVFNQLESKARELAKIIA